MALNPLKCSFLPVMPSVIGLHHVTAIAGDPQRNLDFYNGVLGLRLVKLTVNFDDPGTYHFYFGDARGTPGSIMTFFPWPQGSGGRHGSGQVAVTSFSVPSGSMGFWIERLLRHNVRYQGPAKRGAGADAESVIAFKDPDGLMIELVGHPAAEAGAESTWDGGDVPREHAIRGFHQVTLWVEKGDATAQVLTDTLGFREHAEQETTRRYVIGDARPGHIVEVRSVGGFGRGADGVGVVHHVAFAVADGETQVALRDRVIEAGLHATAVIDRQYFHSVYFRESGGVLFELATVAPGFTVDEPLGQLGTSLKLPPQYESDRALLRLTLPEIHLPRRRSEPPDQLRIAP